VPDEDSSLFNRAEGFWRDFHKLQQRVGTRLAILVTVAVASGGVWWLWDDIAKKPGVTEIVAWVERKPIVPAKPGHLTIAVAHLEDDKNQEHEKLPRDALDNDFDGAESKAVDRTIILPDADTGQDSVAKAEEEANQLRKRAGADVLLWGRVVTLNSKSEMRLYWTTGRELTGVKQSGLYTDRTETIAMPPLFWDDLKQVLGMLVQSRIAKITRELNGKYSADQLGPLIGQVRKLFQSRQGAWNAKTDAEVRFVFAEALSDYGDQTGINEALQESIDAYRRVLEERTRDRVPLDWAMTQNNLGIALQTLVARESGSARLEEAVAAYRAALAEWTRDRVPLDWATTQNNLGTALQILGARESGRARLEEAVAAYRASLTEWTHDRVPLDWATTQNNLGTALVKLGQRESGTARLEEAVAAYRAALAECTRDRVPLD
jgi:exonuclease VII small subunit